MRQGILPTLLRYFDRLVYKLFRQELCRVETSEADFSEIVLREDYETRSITSQDFHESLCSELMEADYREAFCRGDVCIASLRGRKVVGYTFYTNKPTPVNEAVSFMFNQDYLYNYASATATEHRGNKLEAQRWKVGQMEQVKVAGVDSPRIFYKNVVNFESRATGRGYENGFLGYALIFRIANRWFCWNSPGCVRAETGFFNCKGDS
ncbi:MAG: hypothetical protein GKR90_06170 [Pseudomonadales bacterium]|nr:hypothetical protein [Pseudomonadales bacterium]